MARRSAVLTILVLVLAGLYAGYRLTAKRQMVRCILEWGRLAPFPASAEQFAITTEGGPFTRAFRASFRASPEVIRQWMADSPGLQDADVTQLEPGVRKLVIKPGGGAQHAEVLVDDRAHLVRVYAYWS